MSCFDNGVETNPDNLHFEDWLVQQVSSGKFKDLEWIDDEQQRIFKLPWTKKNYPNWEEHHEIFRAWAQYRSLKRNDPRLVQHSISTMKSNFRTVLYKCKYLEELQNFHQLGLQTGNYKVYKVLTSDEVKSKQGCSRPRASYVVDDSNDIVEISSVSGVMDNIQLLPDSEISSSWVAKTSSLSVALLEAEQELRKRPLREEELDVPEAESARPKKSRTQGTQTKKFPFAAKEIVFLPNATPANNHNGSESVEHIGKNKVSQNVENADGFNILLEAAEINSDSPSTESSHFETASFRFDPASSISHILMSLNMPIEHLYAYNVLIKYGSQEGWLHQYREMNKGYLICNDASKLPHKTKHTDLIPVALPSPSEDMGRFFDSVMSSINEGLIIKLDESYNLVLERLCLSRVFVSAFFGEFTADETFCLDRHKQVVVFSYSNFLNALATSAQARETIPLSKLKIFVSIGKKCKGDIENSKVYIGLQLIPIAAETLLKLCSRTSERGT